MSATDHAIWWHVYPLGACGAPIRGDHTGAHGHRLGRLEAWLDYVVELGCSGLLLGPVFASATHGYDTLDHFRLDPRLGDEGDWARLVAQARRRGLLLMLDGVFNHVAAGHELVRSGASGQGMVRLDGGRPRSWEGHEGLVELDHADPRVADLVVEVMRHWLERGADGWRLDVAYAVPAAFWAEVLGRVRRTHPDAVFLGEVIHGDYGAIARSATLDAVTQYELWKATWSALVDRNLWELAWALERHADFCAQAVMQTFVGNHDVTRVASTVGDEGAAIAAALLLTVPGMPSVYYGDEQAFRGAKATGLAADDPLRPQLPERPAALAPHGWWLYRLHQELIGLRRRHAWVARGRLEVEDKTNTSLRYRVLGEGHVLRTILDLDGTPRVQVVVDGQEELVWPG